MVRDQALALSGLLSRKVGGPSVFPPQPDGLWQAAFNGQRTWATSQGEDRYRRGLYTFWRRTVPYPSMATFDAPSREICAIRRVRTNTPLQSFVTLNDPVYVEAAQALARRIVREGGTDVASRVRYALQLCLCRPPRPEQVEPLVALYTSRARALPQGPRRRRGPGHRAARAASRRDGPGRAGRLDDRRQRPPEPRRRLDQRLIPWTRIGPAPGNWQQARAQTRRQFLKTRRPAWAPSPWRCSWTARASAGPVDRPAAPGPLPPRPPTTRWRSGRRTSRPRPSASSICTCRAGRRSKTCSTTSPSWSSTTCSPAPTSCSRTRSSRSSRGIPSCSARRTSSQKCGQSGAVVSELLPHLRGVVDDIAIIKSMYTDQFNHAPAELFLYTGSSRNGGAAMGSWITYGLGSENQDLPGFVVLISGGTDPTGGKALWSTGFLPSVYQGVQCRTVGDPILYVSDPKGMDRADRRRTLDALRQLNEYELAEFGDPETLTRISQYELAFRMQMAVPDVMDIRQEPEHDPARSTAPSPGASSFANNCLLARRLVERGVRYVQLYDWGWDCHGTGAGDDIVKHLPEKCREVDRPIAALLADLKRRGLLDETLVIWGGEFGRTSMNEARGGSKFLGRDHHPHCFTIWMAGGGIKPGITVGATDELGYNITENPVSIHDLQATILHLLGLDAWKLTYAYQGLNQKLIGPEGEAKIRKELLQLSARPKLARTCKRSRSARTRTVKATSLLLRRHRPGDIGWVGAPARCSLRPGVWLGRTLRGAGRRDRGRIHQEL